MSESFCQCRQKDGRSRRMADRVIFNGRFHNQNNCICDCCHEVGNVLMLNIPRTKYNKHSELQTKYKQIWICDDCRKALTTFLVRADNLKENKNE